MRMVTLSDHEIVALLTKGYRAKRNSRSVTYILWHGAVESC